MRKRVFISYSHDSEAHVQRVRVLADKLRRHGVECVIDQYTECPKEGWPKWMERQIHEAYLVLIVCTSRYKARVEGKEEPTVGKGVRWESLLSYQHLYDADSTNSKFVPVVFEESEVKSVPTPLKPFTYYNVERDYEKLYRRITNQPKGRPPRIGKELDLNSNKEGVETEHPFTGEPDEGGDNCSSVVTSTALQPIELTLNKKPEDFDSEEERRFVKAVGELLGISDLVIKRRRPGSIKLTFELPPDKAEQLLWAARGGSLSEFGVVNASFVDLDTCDPRAQVQQNTKRRNSSSARILTRRVFPFAKIRAFKNASEIRALGLYPYFRTISSAQDTEVLIEGKKVLMLGSNSYLGLTNHPKIKEAARAALEKYGTSCAGSRFLNGSLDIHLELEAELAKLVKKEAVLLFTTGFQVNLGVISALVGKGDYVIGDKNNNASIIEGCLLSSGRFQRFAHKDMAALENRLEQIEPEADKLIVVDGVFSMEGDIIQLPELCSIASKHSAAIMIDDAHAIGVLGEYGAGTANHFGLTDQVHLIMGSFSKSLASLGGFVASDAESIDFLRHHSRALIFSASMSPSNAAAVLAAVQIMVEEPQRIAHLWRNTERMKNGLLSLGFNLGDSATPILPVYCDGILEAFKFCKRLQEEGIFANPVVSPAVAPGGELLRVSLMATHTEQQIDFALDRFSKVGKQLALI